MHYYPFHVGDYQTHTAHLSDTEDLAYRRMLDLYYINQKPLPSDAAKVARLIRLPAAVEEVRGLLEEFFVLQDGVYTNKRCDKEIAAFQKQKIGGAKGAKARWDKAKGKGGDDPPNKDGNKGGNGEGIGEGNATPIATKNQNQNQNQKTSEERASRLPADWEPTDELIAFIKKERPDLNIGHTVLRFCNFWHSKAGKDATKLDWNRTFQNWVLNEPSPRVKTVPTINPFAGAL